MNCYRTSDGDYVRKSVIDYNVRKSKAIKLSNQLDEHDYNFCEQCGRSKGDYLDCAHILSVDQCQKRGMSEKAWDVANIRILCRGCHSVFDGLDLKFTKQ